MPTFGSTQTIDLVLSLFRTNQLLLGVLILGYALLLHSVCFWEPATALPDAPGIANDWLQELLNERLSWHLPITIFLLFLQALLVNSLIFQHRMISPVNLFPGVFLVLVSSAVPDFLVLSPYHFANLFFLLALRSYFKAFRTSSAADLLFNVGFLMGIAALFVPTYLFFILGFALMLPVLKSGKFRDQVILLIGTAFPLYLLSIYYFWMDSFTDFWQQQWTDAFGLPQYMDWQKAPFFGLLFMSALLLTTLISRRTYRLKTKMEVQVKLNILYWLLLASGVSALFAMPWNMQHWLAAAPLMGVFLSMNFTKMRSATGEAWHLILLLFIFLLHFGGRLGLTFM